MKRYYAAAAVAAVSLVLLDPGPALADVAGTMTSATTSAVTWVRAGAGLGVIGLGVSLVRGWMGAWGFAPLLAGAAVAIQPEEVVALIA